MSGSLRIALICSHYPPVVGGAEIATQRLAQALATRGHDVVVITLARAGLPASERDPSGALILRDVRPMAFGPFWGITYMKGVRRILRDNGPFDVIHCRTTYLHTLIANEEARRTRAACVSTIASSGALNDLVKLGEHRFGERLVAKAVAPPASFIALAHRAAEETVPLRDGAPCVVIPNFVDTTRYAPAPGLARDERIVYVGRLSPEKNPRGLIDALAMLAPGLDGVSLDLVGGGVQLEDLRAAADRLGVRDRVRFLGSQADVLPFLQRGLIAASASRVEGMSNALLEQLAAGLPAIMPDVGGVHDAMNPAAAPTTDAGGGLRVLPAGVVYPPGDTEALARAMTLLLGDRALLARLAAGARAAAEGHFSPEAIVSRIEAHYRDRIAAARGGTR